MNQTEHLLTCVAEESEEIAQVALAQIGLRLSQAAHKALRFGLDDGYPGTEQTNRDDLVREANDLLGVLELMEEAGIALPGLRDREAIEAKKAKVRRWMAHAEKLGTLQPDTNNGAGETG